MRRNPYATTDAGQERRYAHGQDGIVPLPWRPAIRTPPGFEPPPLGPSRADVAGWCVIATAALYFLAQVVRAWWAGAL